MCGGPRCVDGRQQCGRRPVWRVGMLFLSADWASGGSVCGSLVKEGSSTRRRGPLQKGPEPERAHAWASGPNNTVQTKMQRRCATVPVVCFVSGILAGGGCVASLCAWRAAVRTATSVEGTWQECCSCRPTGHPAAAWLKRPPPGIICGRASVWVSCERGVQYKEAWPSAEGTQT
eukprot:365319-Chlamydomonas_euryale.AAC.13